MTHGGLSMYELLKAQCRSSQAKKASKLRREGMIPGVLFAKDMESLEVQFSHHDFKKILSHKVKVIEVAVEDRDVFLVNLEQVQRDPVNHKILHVSFHRLNKNLATHILVPIKFVGEAQGVSEDGILRQLLDEVMVVGLPHKIPEFLEVKVDSLGVGDHLNVSDIELPPGLSFNEEDFSKAVANCALPKVEEKPVEEESLSSEEEKEDASKEEEPDLDEAA